MTDATSIEPVRILHLSDFHFRAKTDWDSKPVLVGMVDAIKELGDNGLAPDVVAITGDVAYSGKRQEYEQAKTWIDGRLIPALSKDFTRDRILIVPGNHDADREAVGRGAKSIQADLLREPTEEAVAEILGDPKEREPLLRRHEAYLAFAKAYGSASRPLDVPWWSASVGPAGRETRVFVAGLCSSFMCCGDEDAGRLLIGRWQVHELLAAKPDDAEFVVALVHHPWSALAPFDSEDIVEPIHQAADVVLRGHLHAQRSERWGDPDDTCIELAAGSVYDGSRRVNAFQLVELVPGDRVVRVHYRAWYRNGWVPDTMTYKNAPKGVATFHLDEEQGKPPGDRGRTGRGSTTKYLRCLRGETYYIDVRGLEVGSGKATLLQIDQLYIPLTTTARPERDELKEADGEGALEAMREARETDLREALGHRRLVVVGDPGSGKTTFLRRIAFELARRGLGERVDAGDSAWDALGDALPVLIKLDDLARHIEADRKKGDGPAGDDAPLWLAHYLGERSEEGTHGLNEAFFRAALEGGEAVVLLDGLDEVPTKRQRVALRKLIERAAREYEGCRFVVTTRPVAYKGEATLATFDEEATIAPLPEEAIETFLDRWSHALWAENRSQADKNLDELKRALRERPEIRRMARNAVMLTALAVVHWKEKRLPEQRADLYESIIGWLAKSREHRPGRSSEERCVALLQNLALAMQEHPKGRQVQVRRRWGAEAIASGFREVDEPDPVAAAEGFLREEEQDSGIVVGRGEHDVRFWHLTFQEFLAARALAAQDKVRAERLLKTDRLHSAEWREVVLLLGGVLFSQGIEPVDEMFESILARVPARAPLKDKARCAGLLSAILRDLSPVGYRPREARYRELLEEAMAVFDARRSSRIPIEDAIAAAEAIGQAGDPRFADLDSDDLWVTIPAGEFWMGAQKEDPKGRNYDAEAGTLLPEWPVHKVRLSRYRIGRYPVTVAQYRRFVEDDGYVKRGFWGGEGFGEYGEAPKKWEAQREHPTRPVVYVSWHEASAYAAWAECRLPTEAEWERAARGTEGRKYPWGDEEPSPRLLNFKRNVGAATPVGVYPLGASPDGVLDMAGNVWEWCSDLYGEYEGCDQEDPTGPSSGIGRVLRGGSWSSSALNCRAATRAGLGPGGRSDNFGFRVASGT
ncbi:MAG: SUMF1/EgtB/PvdO family nonheme iron enzyme [Phycisphaerae bacterium]|nr:SUMF1/EgtB/PvdO family nonheme iron enzyme [Phycisphaerae bacterium]